MNTITTKADLVEPKAVSEATSPRCEATQDVETEAWAVEAAIKGNLTFGQTREVLAAVTAQRDELLAASKAAIQWLRKANSTSVFENCALPLGGVNAEKQLSAAISKAEQH